MKQTRVCALTVLVSLSFLASACAGGGSSTIGGLVGGTYAGAAIATSHSFYVREHIVRENKIAPSANDHGIALSNAQLSSKNVGDEYTFSSEGKYPSLQSEASVGAVQTETVVDPDPNDVDDDNDGLIEIYTLEDLHNIRYSPDGTSRKTSETDSGSTSGAPTSLSEACKDRGTALCGYELMNDLDFYAGKCTANDNGTPGDTEDDYCEVDTSNPYYNNGKGWTPINEFSAIFDGNGHSIANLYINFARSQNSPLGLFGRTGSGEAVELRNLILSKVNISGDFSGEGKYSYESSSQVGSLVGRTYSGSLEISNCKASGSLKLFFSNEKSDSSRSVRASVGGLVGSSYEATVTINNSHMRGRIQADASTFGSGPSTSNVGGLIGSKYTGKLKISRSSMVGTTEGGVSSTSFAPTRVTIGGLVGFSYEAGVSIFSSYANNAAIVRSQASDALREDIHVGGLLSYTHHGKVEIQDSYATSAGLLRGDLVGFVYEDGEVKITGAKR